MMQTATTLASSRASARPVTTRPQQQTQNKLLLLRRSIAARSSTGDNGAEPSTSSPSSSDSSTTTCARCGVALSSAPWGCGGEGRIGGGIGALPGFGWWPIKAYRPCPALESAGGQYTRKGQITDEMLFGKVKGPKP